VLHLTGWNGRFFYFVLILEMCCFSANSIQSTKKCLGIVWVGEKNGSEKQKANSEELA